MAKKKKEIRRFNIKEIKDPLFLKDLTYKELDVLSEDIRKSIIEDVSVHGGHLSSNLGVVESTISLCRNFDFTKDKIIFDVGHQSYVYKILTGRSLSTLREKDGISGFQKISESIYDHFECGHSSTSISVASGMAIARDLNGDNYDVIAFIGDASIANGLALEGLNLAGNKGENPHKIIIIFNDNDMSISRPVGGLAKSFRSFSNSAFYQSQKSFIRKTFIKLPGGKRFISFLSKIKNWFKRHLLAINLFDLFGYSYIGPIDGHNIKEIDKALRKAKSIPNSVVIHLKTIKGKGYKPAEEDNVGNWHGVGPFNVETGEFLYSSCYTWSKLYEEILLTNMEEHPESVLVVPATGIGSELSELFTKYPERTIDVGISEEHAITMAGGLSISGKHPIISIYSTFLQRGYDNILHDIARMHLSATFLIDRSGFVGKDGDTHQGLYDEGFLYTIPGTIIAMPSNKKEAEYLLEESYKHQCPFFIRYPKDKFQDYETKHEYSFGKWIMEQFGKDIAVITCGPFVHSLKENMIKNKINVTLVNALFLKPLDEEMIKSLLNYKKIVIVDRYATQNGFINALGARLMELNYQGEVKYLSSPDDYIPSANLDQQYEDYHLTEDDVINLLK